jgi:hypothetical protein
MLSRRLGLTEAGPTAAGGTRCAAKIMDSPGLLASHGPRPPGPAGCLTEQLVDCLICKITINLVQEPEQLSSGCQGPWRAPGPGPALKPELAGVMHSRRAIGSGSPHPAAGTAGWESACIPRFAPEGPGWLTGATGSAPVGGGPALAASNLKSGTLRVATVTSGILRLPLTAVLQHFESWSQSSRKGSLLVSLAPTLRLSQKGRWAVDVGPAPWPKVSRMTKSLVGWHRAARHLQ